MVQRRRLWPRPFPIARLRRGRAAALVTLGGGSLDTDDESELCDITLRIDDPHDQARLAELLAQGTVRALHSQEAALEDIFFDVAGVRPA